MEATLMIFPLPCLIISLAAIWHMRNVAVRLTSRTSFQSSREIF
jgi:hypothetical protein